MDKYGKPECPKCLSPLKPVEGLRVEDTRTKAEQDAMQSESGECSKGGAHLWRFGKCAKCGKGEGVENRESSPAYIRNSSGQRSENFHVLTHTELPWKERATQEFQALFDKRLDKSDKGLAKAFEKIDTNGNGTLDAAEIRAFITKAYLRITGLAIEEQMLTDMMSAADADGNGEVDLEEFKVIMRAGGDAASRDSSPARPRSPIKKEGSMKKEGSFKSKKTKSAIQSRTAIKVPLAVSVTDIDATPSTPQGMRGAPSPSSTRAANAPAGAPGSFPRSPSSQRGSMALMNEAEKRSK